MPKLKAGFVVEGVWGSEVGVVLKFMELDFSKWGEAFGSVRILHGDCRSL